MRSCYFDLGEITSTHPGRSPIRLQLESRDFRLTTQVSQCHPLLGESLCVQLQLSLSFLPNCII